MEQPVHCLAVVTNYYDSAKLLPLWHWFSFSVTPSIQLSPSVLHWLGGEFFLHLSDTRGFINSCPRRAKPNFGRALISITLNSFVFSVLSLYNAGFVSALHLLTLLGVVVTHWQCCLMKFTRLLT